MKMLLGMLLVCLVLTGCQKAESASMSGKAESIVILGNEDECIRYTTATLNSEHHYWQTKDGSLAITFITAPQVYGVEEIDVTMQGEWVRVTRFNHGGESQTALIRADRVLEVVFQ